ncbi:DUF2142 domain-containing protein [Oligoflexus tunisiensis]|uniref:DUF2142 domain-containing protein n=1 Tax=Oligoflexus tunisiensis TaxID=708132 RepID=UPI00159F2F89|nr:DUF2142 domain-containing protein [Oligoflexus tunisiensis]
MKNFWQNFCTGQRSDVFLKRFTFFSFALIALLSGLVLCFLTPPFQVPDEPTHLFRAYEISEGHILSVKQGEFTGREIPKSIHDMAERLGYSIAFKYEAKIDLKLLKELWNQRLEQDKKVFANFSNTALYTPIPYLPQAISISILRLFDVPPLALMYGARIFNLIVSVLIITISLRISVTMRYLIWVLALMPMCLFSFASCSADALILSLSFLLAAIVVAQTENSEEKNGKLAPLGSLVFGLLVLSKPVYFPLILPIIFVHYLNKKQGRIDQKSFWVSNILLAFFTLLMLIWNRTAHQIYNPSIFHIKVDPDAQMHWVFDNPITFVQLFFSEMERHIVKGNLLEMAVGGYLGWLDTPLPHHLIAWHIVVISLLALTLPLHWGKAAIALRAVSFGGLLGGCAAIALALYCSWNPVAHSGIDGFQGRYFIPLLPFGLLCFSVVTAKLKRPHVMLFAVAIVSTGILHWAMYEALIVRYYG